MWNIIKYFVNIYCKLVNWYHGSAVSVGIPPVVPGGNPNHVTAKLIGEPIVKVLCEVCNRKLSRMEYRHGGICFSCRRKSMSNSYESISLTITNPKIIIKHRPEAEGEKTEHE